MRLVTLSLWASHSLGKGEPWVRGGGGVGVRKGGGSKGGKEGGLGM